MFCTKCGTEMRIVGIKAEPIAGECPKCGQAQVMWNRGAVPNMLIYRDTLTAAGQWGSVFQTSLLFPVDRCRWCGQYHDETCPFMSQFPSEQEKTA